MFKFELLKLRIRRTENISYTKIVYVLNMSAHPYILLLNVYLTRYLDV